MFKIVTFLFWFFLMRGRGAKVVYLQMKLLSWFSEKWELSFRFNTIVTLNILYPTGSWYLRLRLKSRVVYLQMKLLSWFSEKWELSFQFNTIVTLNGFYSTSSWYLSLRLELFLFSLFTSFVWKWARLEYPIFIRMNTPNGWRPFCLHIRFQKWSLKHLSFIERPKENNNVLEQQEDVILNIKTLFCANCF